MYIWDHFSTLKYDHLPSWQRKWFHKNFYIWDHFSTLKYDPPPPMAEKVHFLMLRYDPTSWPRKDCTQMLDVYVGSFFNVEIWLRLFSKKRIAQKCEMYIWDLFSTFKYDPPPLGREKDSTRLYIFGIIFQRWNMTLPLLWRRRFIFKCWDMTLPPDRERIAHKC